MLHTRYGIPIYANSGTIGGMARDDKMGAIPWKVFTTGMPFPLGDLTIEPFSVGQRHITAATNSPRR